VISEINNLVEETIKAFGGLDVIIGNAVSIVQLFDIAYISLRFVSSYIFCSHLVILSI
jgi:hypothetical protein